MNIHRDCRWLMRHQNRPEPSPRIVRKPDIEVWDDSDTVTIHHMTRAEAERVFRLSLTDPHLYGMAWALGSMLGYDMEDFAA